MRRKLTDVWLRGVKPLEAGRLEIWDTLISGLVLRIAPAGAATWALRLRTLEGKRTRPKIGTWPAMGIAEARKQALAMTANIQAGGDPVALRRAKVAERKERAGLPTVDDQLAAWRGAKGSTWSPRYHKEVLRICTVEISPKLGKRPLIETTRSDWTALIAAKHRHAPGVGSMLYRTAASFLNHAEAHGWISLPLLPRKGLAAIAPPVAPRERVLSDSELRAIWTAADGLKPKAKAFVRLLAMTAARAMEAADIATVELDLSAGTWAIPGTRTKNRRGIVLPLHPLLIADLQAVSTNPQRAGRLLGDAAGGGLRGFSKLKARLDKASGVTGWRWHDLRRTARTGMARLGVSRDHAEAALNHMSARSALERTYDRHDFGPEVISALEIWQRHVTAIVESAPR